MKLHKETWYNKKREGRLFRVSGYILNDPQAFVITMLMGFIMTMVIFSTLAVLSYAYNYGIILTILFSVIAVLNGKKLYQMIQITRKGGTEGIMGKMTIGSFVFNKK